MNALLLQAAEPPRVHLDHVLATLPESGLRVFQSPSGADLAALALRGSEEKATVAGEAS